MWILTEPFKNSDFSSWKIIVEFGIIGLVMIIANILRRKIKPLRNLLFPTAIIAGFLGLGLKYAFIGLNVQIDGTPVLDNSFLEGITYHTIALGFIAMGLKQVKDEKTSKMKGKPAKTGLLIVNTYLIQGVIGVLVTVLLALFLKSIAPYAGILLPMGFGQGPGQAGNIGLVLQDQNVWPIGGTEGWQSGHMFGLALATIGTIWACVVGVFYINRRAKEGKITRVNEEKAKEIKSEQIESPTEIPVSEAIDKMSIQVILVILVYAATYLTMKGITSIMESVMENPKQFTGLIWGFNFIFGMLFAIIAKIILKALTKSGLMKRKYTNEYMLNRITGVVFDFMIVASIMAINVEDFKVPGLLVGLLILTTIGGFLTYFYLKFSIKKIYPEYEHEAFATLFGNLTGTASNGIALLREIDPEFASPAADDLVTGSSFAVAFGAPILIITGLIYQSWLHLWICVAIMAVIFVVYNLFMFEKIKIKFKKNTNNEQEKSE